MTTSPQADMLWQQYLAAPTTELRNEIVAYYLPLVKHCAALTHRRAPATDMDELISIGNAALVRCVPRFDPARNSRFTTYAYFRIHGSMKDWLRKLARIATVTGSGNVEKILGSTPCHATAIENIEFFAAAIRQLPPAQRHILQQHYFEGVSFCDIGEKMGVTRSWISQVHLAAIASLRRRITGSLD